MNITCNAHTCTLTVNGVPFRDELPPDVLLLDLLRERVGLETVTHGCDHGHCGACTVLLDGVPAKSCLVLAISVPDAAVVTADALPSTHDLHHVGQVLAAADPEVCSECLPARILSLFALNAGGQPPTAERIRAFIHDNPCRCGGQACEGQVADMSSPERAGAA